MGKSHDLATLKDDGGTFGGDLVIDSGTADGGQLHLNSLGNDTWFVDNYSGNLRFFQNGLVRQNIDASGRVTMPYQPSFNIYQSGPWSLTAGVWGQNVNLDTARHNVGNHFNTSNGSFTAPISGKYLLTYISHFNSSTPSYFYSGIQINGGFEVYLFGYNAAVSGGDNTFGGSTILHINANDVVTFWNYDGDGGTIGHGYQRTHASGHLIG